MKEHRLEHQPGKMPAALKSIPFFQGMEPDTLETIVANTTILDCELGDRVTEEGDADRSLFFLLEGTLRVIKDGTTIASARASGALLGELALLNETGTRSASLVVERAPCYVLKVDQGFLESLNAESRNAYYAWLYRFLANLLAERLERTSNPLAAAEKRLAESGG